MRCSTAVGWSESTRNSMPFRRARFIASTTFITSSLKWRMIFPSRISTATITARRDVERAVCVARRAPEHIHLVGNGRLIHAADFKHVAQIHRRAFAAQADDRAEHVVLGFVFAGKLHREIASLGAHRAAGDHRVARANRIHHHLRRQAVAGDVRVGKQQIDRLPARWRPW